MSTRVLSRTNTRSSSRGSHSSRRSIVCMDGSKTLAPNSGSTPRSTSAASPGVEDGISRSLVPASSTPSRSKSPFPAAPLLPNEVIDLILDALFTCSLHTSASRHDPCIGRHQDDPKPSTSTSGSKTSSKTRPASLFPLRLVNRSFHSRLTPILFYHMTCRSPVHRHRMLLHFSNKPHLTPLIKVLRFEIAPADLGGRLRRVTQNPLLAPDAKLRHYFEVLRVLLGPVLKKFHALQTLHITTTYSGMTEKRLPKLEVLPQCFDALVECVRRAELASLEDITLGMPYEGGWTNFFEDLEDSRYERGLRRCGKNVRTASVKLYDHQGGFTTMPFF